MEKEATNDEKKRYMYEPPSILDIYKSEFTGDNKELIYINFLLQRLPAIDVESKEQNSKRIREISIRGQSKIYIIYDDLNQIYLNISLNEFLKGTINAQKGKIPYVIELAYTNDEDFRNFVQGNYSDWAEKLDAQVKENNRSETYDLFYQYFINDHEEEPRIVGIITNKQCAFYTTRLMYKKDGATVDSGLEHGALQNLYIEKTQFDVVNSLFFLGEPRATSEAWGNIDYPSKLSYSQGLFVSDCLEAYKEAKKDLGDTDRSRLEKKFETTMQEMSEKLKETEKNNYAVSYRNLKEVIIGKTRTKEEIKEQISYDMANSENMIGTILYYGKDIFYRDLFCETFPKASRCIEIWKQMIKLNITPLWIQNANTKADFDDFYKEYMNSAYKKVQERESELKNNKSQFDKEMTSIDMYKRRQDLRGYVAKLQEKAQEVENEISGILSKNEVLLPSIYKKQNIFQRIENRIIRFIKRREVTELNERIETLQLRKKGIENQIRYYEKNIAICVFKMRKDLTVLLVKI